MAKPLPPLTAIRSLATFVVVSSFVFSPVLQIFNLSVSAAVPPIPDFTYAVLAAAPREDVLNPTGNNVTTNSNGSEWYFNTDQSMGFAPNGGTISQNSADTSFTDDPLRLSWHLNGANFDGGWRAGATTGLNSSTEWKKEIYQSNSLPSYYPSGPQANVSVSTVTSGGWTLCFSADYGLDTTIEAALSGCTGNYLMLAGGTVMMNKIEVKKADVSVLDAPGGTQLAETILYAGDVLQPSLFEPDGSTPITWTNYKFYVSTCTIAECPAPGSPLAVPGNWDGGDTVTGTYIVPLAADDHHVAVLVADDETGDPVNANYIVLNIRHTPEERTISDCAELQLMNDQLADNYTLTNNIDCSETELWNEGDGFMPIGDTVNRFMGNLNGHGYAITGLHINRPFTDYVGLFGVIEIGAQVHDLSITNATIVGSDEVGILAGALSGTATNVNTSGSVSGSSNIGGLVGDHVQPLGSGSSSPLVYTWNGERYTYVADVGRGIPRNTVGDDYAQIDSDKLAPKDGKYSINISEEYNEIVYYDELALMTFDHAPGYRVLTTLAKGHDGQFYTVSDSPSNPLQSCTDQYGNNCLASLQSNDDQWSYKDDSNLNYWTMNFGDLSSAANIKLLIQGARDYSIKNGSTVKYIQVKDAGGNWVNAYTSSQLSTLYGAPLTEAVDMHGKFLTNDYSVRVAFDRTRMNYFAIDTSAPVEYTVNTIHPDSANLQFRGYSAIDKTYFWNHDFYTVSATPDEVFANQIGNFTKYGEVAPLLSDTDDHPVVIHNGDNMDISFDYTAPAEGMERSFILYNWATFKHADMGPVGLTVDPIPHVGMSSYPSDYPMTSENLDYMRTWNTRVVTGRIGGGSTIISSFSSADVVGYDYVGGLVGYNDSDKLITGSYATGSVTSSDEIYGYYMGGLVGENDGEIEDSYATGNVTAGENSDYLGGLIGQNYGDISRSYATGNVTGGADVGGFAGYNDGSINDAYSRGNVVATGSNVAGFVGYNSYRIVDAYSTGIPTSVNPDNLGAFAGYDSGDIQFTFWDNDIVTGLDACGSGDCSDMVVGKSTADMKLIATYTTDLGEPAWNFEETWAFVAGRNNDYPVFEWRSTHSGDDDGISTEVEKESPNDGDANEDGISDDGQYNVTSFPSSVNNKYISLEMPTDCTVSNATDEDESGLEVEDAGFEYQSGLINFSASCGTNGYTAQVTLYFYGVTSDSLAVRKYDAVNHSYSTITDAVITHVTIAGEDVVKVVYSITDGGDLDQDGVANGVIVDPVGLGGSNVGAPNTGFGGLSK